MLRNPPHLALEVFDYFTERVKTHSNRPSMLEALAESGTGNEFHEFKGLVDETISILPRLPYTIERVQLLRGRLKPVSSVTNINNLKRSPADFSRLHLTVQNRQVLEDLALDYSQSPSSQIELAPAFLAESVASMREPLEDIEVDPYVINAINLDIHKLQKIAEKAHEFKGDFNFFWSEYLDLSAKIDYLLSIPEEDVRAKYKPEESRPWLEALKLRFYHIISCHISHCFRRGFLDSQIFFVC